MTKTRATSKAPRGSIGPATYAAVKRLKDQGMDVTKAFEKVAKESGRSAATVATTYYRIAKQQEGGRAAKSARKAAGQSERLAADAKAAIDALHKHVARLEAELADLTAKTREVEKIKASLKRL
jgi:predicted  nucleic acid-binding Zn-ribbon protein